MFAFGKMNQGVESTITRKNWAVALAATMLAMAACAADPAASAVEVRPPPTGRGCRPEYPRAAVRAGAQGAVTMRLHVEADGTVSQVDVVQSSGTTYAHKLLDRAAVEAMLRCQVAPNKDAAGNAVPAEFNTTCTRLLD